MSLQVQLAFLLFINPFMKLFNPKQPHHTWKISHCPNTWDSFRLVHALSQASSLLFFFHCLLFTLSVSVLGAVNVYVHLHAGALGSQRRQIIIELELQL